MRLGVLAVSALLVVGAGGCAGSGGAAPPPLVVYKGEGGRSVRPEGLQRLTSHPSSASSPAWSADGNRLFYLTSTGLTSEALWVLDRRTGHQQRLLEGDLADPCPTADGRSVLLAKDGDIWRFEPATRRLVQLVATPWEESGPVARGPGGGLVFSRQAPEGGAARDLWAVNAGGEAARRLTNGFDDSPAAGPGGRLAFLRRQEVWVHSGGEARALTNRFSDGTAGHPSWSPEGARIAFGLTKRGRTDLWVADVGTGERRRLVHDTGSDPQPAWSPAGGEIVFVCEAGRHRQLCRLPAPDVPETLARRPPRRVLVVPLEPRSERAKRGDLGQGLARVVGDALVATGAVRLVERSGLEAVLQEHEFSLSDLVDNGRRVELGRMVGADVVVMGFVDYGYWTVRVHLRAVDARTAEVLYSDTSEVTTLMWRKSDTLTGWMIGGMADELVAAVQHAAPPALRPPSPEG